MEFRVAAAVLTLCLIKIRQSSGHGPAFLIHDKSQSWYDAYLACQRSHLSLVIPTHLDLQDLYERLPKDVYNVWLGGRKVHTDWRWVDGGQDPVTDLGCILQSELPANARVITEEHPFTCLGSCSTKFAAMQGNKCTCLESPPLVYVSDSMCNFLCSANFDQFCGGKQTATLYRMQSTFIPWDSTQYLNKDCAYLHAYGSSVHLRTDDCEGPSVLYKQALCQHCSSGGDNCSVTRSDNYMLWSQAREYCSNKGQQLLTVRDNRTLPRMQEWTEERYWIGLKRESRLKWINGSAIDDAIVITSKDGFCVMARRMDGFIAVETIDCSTRLPVACHSAGIKGTKLKQSYSSTSITSKIENFTNISHTSTGIINQREFQSSSVILPSSTELQETKETEAASISFDVNAAPNSTKVDVSEGQPNTTDSVSGITSHFTSRLDTTQDTSKWMWTTADDRNSSPQTADLNSYTSSTDSLPNRSTKVDVSEGQPNTPDSVSGITSHFTSRLDMTQDTSKWIWTTADDRNSSPQTADLNSYTSTTDSPPNRSTKVDVSEGQPNTTDSVSGITSHFTSRLDTTRDTSEWMWTTEDDRNSSPQTADLNSYTSSTDSPPNGSTKVDVSEGQSNTPDSVSGITSHFTSRLDTTQDTSKWMWTTADDRNSSPQTADLNSYTSSTDSPPNRSTKVDVTEGQPNTPDSVSGITSQFTSRLDTTQDTSKWIWTTADDRNSSPQTADLNSYTSSTDSPPNGTKKTVGSSEPDWTKMTTPLANHRMEPTDLTPLYITLGVLGGLAFIALFVAIFIRKYRARRNTMDLNLLEKGSVPSSSPGCSHFRESLSSD